MNGIDILPSDDQLEIVDGLTRALADLPVAGADVATVAALGFVGAGVAPEFGGPGLSIADEMLLNIEFGRRLAGIEILAGGLAARLAAASGDLALVADLIAGTRTAGFAAPMSGWGEGDAGPRGEVHLVGAADVFLAVSHKGAALLDLGLLDGLEPVEGMDGGAKTVRAKIIGDPAWTQSGVWPLASLCFAAQLCGVAMAARDLGADYAKVRVQFDKPIGSFQGVAHQLADCAVRAEAAYSQALFAAIALRDGAEDAGFQVTAAVLTAMDAAVRNATTNIQVHGAMGYSSITGAHLYLKRAVVLRQLAGGPRQHERAALAVRR